MAVIAFAYLPFGWEYELGNLNGRSRILSVRGERPLPIITKVGSGSKLRIDHIEKLPFGCD
jgi:hypothetical protein